MSGDSPLCRCTKCNVFIGSKRAVEIHYLSCDLNKLKQTQQRGTKNLRDKLSEKHLKKYGYGSSSQVSAAAPPLGVTTTTGGTRNSIALLLGTPATTDSTGKSIAPPLGGIPATTGGTGSSVSAPDHAAINSLIEIATAIIESGAGNSRYGGDAIQSGGDAIGNVN